MAKRPIFEEAGASEAPRAAARSTIEAPTGARRAIRVWLGILFLMVAAMIAVGGLTRLTDSGLSITEWRPVSGALPPMTEADWQAEFDLYQQIDQFHLLNAEMTLSEFKSIYWWEWSHRQLGRAVGLVWALGFLGFLAFRKIPPGWHVRLLIPGVLGGVQGAIGWWMVSSGITAGEGVTSVASYRLATHLGLAFVILGVLAWDMFLLGRPEAQLLQARRGREAKLYSLSTGLMHFAFLQILLGALVAGIDAGRGYTDWPLMAGGIFPPGMWELTPVWRNLFENDGTVQFIHRLSGYLLFVFGVIVWNRGRKSSYAPTRSAFHMVFAALAAQVVLGIVTVMQGAPLALGLSHQLLAVLLWVLIIRARYLAQYPLGGTIRRAA
ncbi:heme A synthase [Pararhodobacter aggregans]|uniref:Heme A synthase n=1 Tax=Pararhodobacter aggregans TaxID=404875 RepID=A0A2T7UVZ9_9RHOB|nr:heme A synthase [Pararhodobacter aggregans]PTX03755.1 cytochrome c oxidase assembly protein subunit 15 [Pararhodobacter aggregans]PVE48756.1 heme A synthase [Pararhodobacter aggregans]